MHTNSCQSHCPADVRKIFFAVRVVKTLNCLPAEPHHISSLSIIINSFVFSVDLLITVLSFLWACQWPILAFCLKHKMQSDVSDIVERRAKGAHATFL